MKKTRQIAISTYSFHFIWHHAFRWVSDIGYYRIISNTTVSVCRNPSFLTKEIRSESSESDDGKWTENTLNNRKMTESIRSDLIVASSRIFIRSDRIRPSYIHRVNGEFDFVANSSELKPFWQIQMNWDYSDKFKWTETILTNSIVV
jgi:hypothetical protein